ncbi:hybrid sensory histidine kinase BarA [Novipirellula galeiformis]|uniref:Hybrid sensory histidine kinase BarA n=1 Tax=Novipirellula galeiformis TaxID=2528004 RepID=A0A5C6CAL9_9BACT|nr:Hpt domain-containing protein [Novipirellula galeiformis]TWU20426.1 hybrid sensory histidine kinase BarA [Novipirellula galeiformis]
MTFTFTSDSHAPIIDRELLIRRMMGSTEMAKRMLHRFVETCPEEYDLIESTVRLGDKDSVASIAHRHKGTAQTMASQRVAEIAAELEIRAHSDSVSELLEMVEQLRALHREVQKFVSDEFPDIASEKGRNGK